VSSPARPGLEPELLAGARPMAGRRAPHLQNLMAPPYKQCMPSETIPPDTLRLSSL
jgi:hypothetical protein